MKTQVVFPAGERKQVPMKTAFVAVRVAIRCYVATQEGYVQVTKNALRDLLKMIEEGRHPVAEMLVKRSDNPMIPGTFFFDFI